MDATENWSAGLQGRVRWLDHLTDPAAHAEAFDAIPELHHVVLGPPPPTPLAVPDGLRVVAWNLERGRHVGDAASILRADGADVVLATELDVGMARSGNRHTALDLADALGLQAAFGVEFVELGLGDEHEQARVGADADNEAGLHGNAILSRLPLIEPEIVRIERDGSWFSPTTDQPRIGGRMAVMAGVDLGECRVGLCSVHLESESDPDLRAEQFAVVLEAVDRRFGAGPVVIGGDLNTFSAGITEVRDDFGRLHAADPSRWAWPVPYEPLFDDAARRGYVVDGANRAEQTMRLAADQRPGTLLRLDWLLVRGLTTREPVTLPALGGAGDVLSDHDAVGVTVAPED